MNLQLECSAVSLGLSIGFEQNIIVDGGSRYIANAKMGLEPEFDTGLN